jgi:hypothetical protein
VKNFFISFKKNSKLTTILALAKARNGACEIINKETDIKSVTQKYIQQLLDPTLVNVEVEVIPASEEEHCYLISSVPQRLPPICGSSPFIGFFVVSQVCSANLVISADTEEGKKKIPFEN